MNVLLGLIYVALTAIILFVTIKYSLKAGKKAGNFLKNIVLSRQDYLQQLVDLLFQENQNRILEDINSLEKSPRLFVQSHPHIFKQRDIEPSDIDNEYVNLDILFKTVLVHHLNLQGNFLCLDWKQSGQDGLNSINGLLNSNRITSISVTDKKDVKRGIYYTYLDYESKDFLDTFNLLTFISKLLNQSSKVTLMEFCFGGDTYDLFVLPKSKVAKLMELSNKLKFSIVDMS